MSDIAEKLRANEIQRLRDDREQFRRCLDEANIEIERLGALLDKYESKLIDCQGHTRADLRKYHEELEAKE